MSAVSELLIRRRSIRKFTDEKLSSEETELILRAALLSPTSKNSRSWEFVVVEDKAMLDKLSKCKPGSASFVANAAMAVVVFGNPLLSDVWIEDASIASAYMLIQAEDLDIGACWIQVRKRNYSDAITSAEYINDLLDIPAPLEPLCILAFGKKEKPRSPHDIADLPWEKVHIGSYRS